MISKNLKQRIYTSLVLLILTFLIFNFNILQIYFLIILGVISFLEFSKMMNEIFFNKFKRALINISFVIYIFIFCLLFFLFSNIAGFKLILFILLMSCVASDVGGFISGKTFKGPKLTKISPNKTYSGAIGSIVLTIIIMYLFFYFYVGLFDYKIFLTAIMTSLSCQFGDLFFSFLKRKAKLKDTGNLFPGHGGVLDRLDGIFLGVPIGFLTLLILN